jgi:hypothetical protein
MRSKRVPTFLLTLLAPRFRIGRSFFLQAFEFLVQLFDLLIRLCFEVNKTRTSLYHRTQQLIEFQLYRDIPCAEI